MPVIPAPITTTSTCRFSDNVPNRGSRTEFTQNDEVFIEVIPNHTSHFHPFSATIFMLAGLLHGPWKSVFHCLPRLFQSSKIPPIWKKFWLCRRTSLCQKLSPGAQPGCSWQSIFSSSASRPSLADFFESHESVPSWLKPAYD